MNEFKELNKAFNVLFWAILDALKIPWLVDKFNSLLGDERWEN